MSARLWSIALVVCLASLGFAQENADRALLRYQWNAGEEITWQVTSETTGSVLARDLTKDPAEEQTQEIWTSASIPLTLVVQSVDADGNATVSYRMGVIEMDMTMQGQQTYMRIDAQAGTMTVNGEEQQLPAPMLDAMLQEMTMVISPRGEMLDVQFPEGSPFGGMPGFDMTQWMRMGQQWQATFPEQPIPVGYSWGVSMPVPFGPLAEAEAGAAAGEVPAAEGEAPTAVPAATMVFTLAGWETVGEAQCARIDMAGAMDIEELPMPMGGGMGMGMGTPEGMQMKLGPMHVSLGGSMLFDPTAGRLASAQMSLLIDLNQHISGTVETPEGQQEVDTEIVIRDLAVETTVEPQ